MQRRLPAAAVRLLMCCMAAVLSRGEAPAIGNHGVLERRADTSAVRTSAQRPSGMQELRKALASQAAEIELLKDLILDLTRAVKSASRPARSPMHFSRASPRSDPAADPRGRSTGRRQATPMPMAGNWTVPLKVKVLTTQFDPFSIRESDGTFRGYTHDFLSELLSTSFPETPYEVS
jgi:hypothetical protein